MEGAQAQSQQSWVPAYLCLQGPMISEGAMVRSELYIPMAASIQSQEGERGCDDPEAVAGETRGTEDSERNLRS